jgi:hypothetical protein
VSQILSWLKRSADCTYSPFFYICLDSLTPSRLRSSSLQGLQTDHLNINRYHIFSSKSTVIRKQSQFQNAFHCSPSIFLAALSVIVATRNPLGQSTSPHQQPVERGLIFISSCRWPAQVLNRRALGRNQHNCMRLGRNCPDKSIELVSNFWYAGAIQDTFTYYIREKIVWNALHLIFGHL